MIREILEFFGVNVDDEDYFTYKGKYRILSRFKDGKEHFHCEQWSYTEHYDTPGGYYSYQEIKVFTEHEVAIDFIKKLKVKDEQNKQDKEKGTKIEYF